MLSADLRARLSTGGRAG